jgi:DNA modification methylase
MNIKSKITDRYTLYNGDCVEVTKQLPDEFAHFQIFSPPFANLYIYSDDLRDMGNCKNIDEFFKQFDYLIPELYRTLKSGRLCAVHCKQIVKYTGRDGQAGWQDFRGEIIRHFEKFGFQYHSEIVIWTDPVLEMQKTKTQRLLYCQLQRDASHTGIGMPEYLVIFRKWNNNDNIIEEPIKHYKNKDDCMKDDGYTEQLIDLETWQKYASPVWFDIRRTDVLNSKTSKDSDDEKHICPLQLEVIKRAVELWTNPNEIVFTPFLGIGSEVYQSLKLGRRGVGIELKESYFNQAVKNCDGVANEPKKIALF